MHEIYLFEFCAQLICKKKKKKKENMQLRIYHPKFGNDWNFFCNEFMIIAFLVVKHIQAF
jgi:hypothetical protein